MTAVRLIAAAGAGLAMLLAPAVQAASPEGVWEIEMRDSRYRVELCGDGTQLCGTLVWLGNGAETADNLPYMNTLLMDRATQTAPQQWRGEVRLFGYRADVTARLVSEQQISARGCIFRIICRTYQLYRHGD